MTSEPWWAIVSGTAVMELAFYGINRLLRRWFPPLPPRPFDQERE